MTSLIEAEEATGALSAEGTARSTVARAPLSTEELRNIDAYWRACNYLALGMIYLQANPLLREPLKPEHIKSRLLGHWGSSPGLAFIYTHLSRLIREQDLEMIFLAPGPRRSGSISAHISRRDLF
jgi:xylulose-5-phosphate/fructose-6-phosphate phosphoketolase